MGEPVYDCSFHSIFCDSKTDLKNLLRGEKNLLRKENHKSHFIFMNMEIEDSISH